MSSASARDEILYTLERVRRWSGFYIVRYVVMPEHIPLLMSEPERGTLAVSLQMLKQIVSRKFGRGVTEPFWQARYYDFNVFSEHKCIEKLRYMHDTPVKRGLIESPELWRWGSFRHGMTGEHSPVELESQWTAREREKIGVYPVVEERGGEM